MKVRDCFAINPAGNTSRYTDFINYIDTSSVNAGSLCGISFLEEDFPSRAQRLVKQGDILYSSVRPNLRHYHLYKDKYKHVVASTGFVLLRNKSGYNTQFAFYYLSTNEIVKHLSNIAELSQSTFPSFSPKDIGKIDLPEIDTLKQKKIVAILSTYDNLIEVNNKRIKVLEQMAENLYKEWFVRFRFPGHETATFENGIPKGWKPGYLREIMSFSSGKPKPNDGTAFPVYGGNGITDWCNSYSHENVIILGRVGAYCGSTYFETGKCWISDNALYRISKRNDFKSFFYDYMLLKALNLNKFQGGTGQPLITQGLLSRIKCILPSNDMVYSYDSVVRPIFDLIRTIHAKNNNLVKQRDLLLPRLMSGKLEV